MNEPPVLTRVHSGVAYVVLNRPAARNAVTVNLARALYDALSDAAVYADLIVLRGAGGNFCSGVDLPETARLRQQGPEALRPLFETLTAACELVAELPVPVVAAVEGVATGGGFELVQAADIAIVRDDAVLADDHANAGMGPSGGGSQRLPRVVGLPRALGHLLTGDRLSGREAAEWGLVYRSVPPPEFERAVGALVANLERKDRNAQARIKQLVRAGVGGPLADGVRMGTEASLVDLPRHRADAGTGRSAQRSRGR